MKDRQPTQVLANGAIRYGIYGADGTLDHYEYMKREDEPTIEGTPLNKANLLSDVTENKIWNNKEKPADPTVNDALYELSKGTARIGDISMTARGDRSASWLPCDGRSISNVEYPDLYNVLRTDVDAGDWDEVAVPGMLGTHASISYANGHWFVVAKSENNYSLKIATSDDLEAFSVASVANVGTVYNTVVGCSPVRYYDGKYIFAYYTVNGPSQRICVVYATSPSGPWRIAVNMNVNNQDSYISWIPGDVLIYGGICYVLFPMSPGVTTQKHSYIYASDLTGSWTVKHMSNEYFNMFVQDEGYGPIYANKDRDNLSKFNGLNSNPTTLNARFGYPYNGIAVSGDKIITIEDNKISYSLDGGQTIAGTTLFGQTFGYTNREIVAYNGNILAVALIKSSQHYIAVMSALDTTPVFVETDYNITGLGINGSVVAGIVDTSSDAQVKILKRDFSYSAKRIPRITPDGRSYAYIKALEE